MKPEDLLPVSELEPEELTLVQQLLSSKATLADAIPDEIPENELWSTLTACCKSLAACRHAVSQLKPAIGRLLLVLQSRPEIYKAHGYKTYDDLMSRGMRDILGVPRSEAYAAVRLVNKWPSLGLEDFKTCTYSKIMEISKYTEESSPSANKYLAAAQSLTLDQLKDFCVNQGVTSKEDSDLAQITILTTRAVKTFWIEAINDPQIRAYCQTDDPGVILECLLSETLAEWRGRMLLQMENSGAEWVPRLPASA